MKISDRPSVGSCKLGRWPTAEGRSGPPAAADRGRRRQQRASPGRRPPSPPLCLPRASSTVAGHDRYGGGPPPPAPASAAWAVAHDCFVEAGSEGGGAGPGSQVDGRRHGVRLWVTCGWTGARRPAPGAPDGEEHYWVEVLDADVYGTAATRESGGGEDWWVRVSGS
jgi:hypothetical protein